jgi:hypothetical protein
MSNRISIASQIYAGLILQDLQGSIDNPMINAQRALLFADALLVCDKMSSQDEGQDPAMEVQILSKVGEDENAILIRAAKARFASQVDNRRAGGRNALN